MYDAVLGRFLSPDNYVQDPYNTQSFNRYGYVWNNPLSYNDPSGELIFTAIAVGALIGAYIGGAQANGNWNPLKWNWSSGSTWGGVLGGAIIGSVSGGIGAYASVGASALLSAAGITGGILGNALTGLAGGIGGGFFSGFGMSYLPGGDKQGLRNGLKGALLGGISAFILGAGIGALTTPKGHNILTGAELRPRVASVNLEAKSVSSLKSSTNLRAQTEVPELSTSPPSVQPPVESPQYFKKIIGLDGRVKFISSNSSVGNKTNTFNFTKHGELTDGVYTVSKEAMKKHVFGGVEGKSIFYPTLDAEVAVLKAARYADKYNLWIGNKAKIPVLNSNVGTLGNGTPTNFINIYRNSRGFIHGTPGTIR
jgi:hypothetical protein